MIQYNNSGNRLVVFIQTSFEEPAKSKSLLMSRFQPLEDDVTIFVLRGGQDTVVGDTIFYSDRFFPFMCIQSWICSSRETLILTDEDLPNWTQGSLDEAASAARKILELDSATAQVCFSATSAETDTHRVGGHQIAKNGWIEPDWWALDRVEELVAPILVSKPDKILRKSLMPPTDYAAKDYVANRLSEDASRVSLQLVPSLIRSSALMLIIERLRTHRPGLSAGGLYLARAGFTICSLFNRAEEPRRAMYVEESVDSDQLTVVTGLIAIPGRKISKRSTQNYNYHDYCMPTLSLRHPMVIYVSTDTIDLVREVRGELGLLEKTRIIETSIEELDQYKNYKAIERAAFANVPPYNKPEHLIAVVARYELLQRSVSSNPFKTTHFAWIDFAASHIVEFPSNNILRPQIDDRVRASWIARWRGSEQRFTFNHKAIAGGCLLAHAEVIPELINQHREAFQMLLSLGHCINDDQLLYAMFEQNRELFNTSHSGYASVLKKIASPIFQKEPVEEKVAEPKQMLSKITRLLASSNLEEALGLLPSAKEICFESADVAARLAIVLETNGLTEESRLVVARLLRSHPDDASAQLLLINNFWRLNAVDVPFVLGEKMRVSELDALHEATCLEELEDLIRVAQVTGSDLRRKFCTQQGVFRTELVSRIIVKMAALDQLKRGSAPLNVALLIGSLNRGGAEKQASRVIQCLAADPARIRDITLFCNKHELENIEATYYEDISNLCVDLELISPGATLDGLDGAVMKISPEFTRVIDYLPTAIAQQVRHLANRFIDKNIAVVHAWLDSANIISCLAALIAGVPRIVLSARGLAPVRQGLGLDLMPYHRPAESWRACYRYLLRHPCVTLFHNSELGRASYQNWLDIHDEVMPVIMNGVDAAQLESEKKHPMATRYPELEDTFVIGTVGRLAAVKRPLLWIRAAMLVLKSAPNCKFLIVGDGPLLDDAISLVESQRLSESFIFTGKKSSVGLYLRMMNIFLMTSAREGLPNALIEAQVLGIPVIATDVGGVPEIVQDGQTGRLLDSDASAERIAAEVLACIDNQAWMQEAARAAKRLSRQEFGMAKMYREVISLYFNRE